MEKHIKSKIIKSGYEVKDFDKWYEQLLSCNVILRPPLYDYEEDVFKWKVKCRYIGFEKFDSDQGEYKYLIRSFNDVKYITIERLTISEDGSRQIRIKKENMQEAIDYISDIEKSSLEETRKCARKFDK